MDRPIAPANPASPAQPTVVGIVADTHIPDRVMQLHPLLIAYLREAQVTHILHAGDICTQRVLDELGQVAPVTAVRGNRDVLFWGLPLVQEVELGGVRIVLTHGHGGLKRYLIDKISYIRFGYKLDRYLPMLRSAGRAAQVVIFGHTHFPLNRLEDDLLLLNPGSACSGSHKDGLPSFALLRIDPDQHLQAEIIKLPGYQVQNRNWVPIKK